MRTIFTICSNNYLAQALVLAASVRKFHPSRRFVLGLVDKKANDIPYDSFGFEVLEASVIEPDIERLAEKYSIVELNTCVKPAYFSWLFENGETDEVIYLDPDTCLYKPMDELDDYFATADILLTPHVLTPVPLDGRKLGENLFLNYGLYNLGFLALRRSKETSAFLDWWKERTYSRGFNNPALGFYTDQLWINLVPVYFERVALIRHRGYNMGPWNLHERGLSPAEPHMLESDAFLPGPDTPLVFYHFSGFRPAAGRLNTDEALYHMQDRQDLYPLYQRYKADLERMDHVFYASHTCHYVEIHKLVKAQQERDRVSAERRATPFYRKALRRIRQLLHAPWNKWTIHSLKNMNA